MPLEPERGGTATKALLLRGLKSRRSREEESDKVVLIDRELLSLREGSFASSNPKP